MSSSTVTVRWVDPGLSQGKTDTVARKFIQDEGDLVHGQKVKVQLSRKKGSRAKVWNATVVDQAKDDRAREPPKKKKSKKNQQTKEKKPPAHIRRSVENLENDEFEMEIGNVPPPTLDGEKQQENTAHPEKEDEEKRLAERRRLEEEEEYQWRLLERKKEEDEYQRMLQRRKEENEEYQRRLLEQRKEEQREYERQLLERRNREQAHRSFEEGKRQTEDHNGRKKEQEHIHVDDTHCGQDTSPDLFSSDDSCEVSVIMPSNFQVAFSPTKPTKVCWH